MAVSVGAQRVDAMAKSLGWVSKFSVFSRPIATPRTPNGAISPTCVVHGVSLFEAPD
jgi:hypothetical protein